MKGRIPEPTKLKLLKGVRSSRINQKEPKPKIASSNIPQGWSNRMSDGAKRFWKRHAPILKEQGLLTELDLSSFRILCELYSSYIQIMNIINKKGLVGEDAGGYIRERPEVKIKAELEKRYLSYMQQFGLSPASRTKVSVDTRLKEKNKDFDW